MSRCVQKHVRHSTFSSFVVRWKWKFPPFWLIADAKIQKITPSLKYLMEKEVSLMHVYIGADCEFWMLHVNRGKMERKKGREMRFRYESKIQQALFFHHHLRRFLFVAPLLFAVFVRCVEISWMFEFHFNRIKIMKEQIRDSTKRLWNVKPSNLEMWIHAALNCEKEKKEAEGKARADE